MAAIIKELEMDPSTHSETENLNRVDSDNEDGILSTYSLPACFELNQSSKEQQSCLTRSQYALVVFHGVADTYPTDSDILCRYTLTEEVEATPGDRIVLFAVGWSTIKDYIVFEWAPVPENGERDLTVVFKAIDLPKDVNEFYQVCYVSNEGAVCGASIPFQVRTPNNEELTCDLEEDMVVVRSSTAVAQDKLFKAQLDRKILIKKNINLETQLRCLQDEHSFALKRLDQLQDTLCTSGTRSATLQTEIARLLNTIDELLCVKQKLEESELKLSDAECFKKNMLEDIQDLNTEIREYQTEMHRLEAKVKDLDNELIAATKKIEILQTDLEKSGIEVALTCKKLEKSEEHGTHLVDKIFSLENELKVCKFNLNNSQVENLKLKAEFEDVSDENTKLKKELQTEKESKVHSDMYGHDMDKGRLVTENSRLQRVTEDLQMRISTLEHEISVFEQVLEDAFNAQKNTCPEHCNLEKEVAQLQYRLDKMLNKEETPETKQSCSSAGKSSHSETEIATLSKLLDDSLKENELRLQENVELRLMNEFLESKLPSPDRKLENQIVVSCPNVSNTDSYTCSPEILALKVTNEEFQQQLVAKDEKIVDLHIEMEALKNKFSVTEKELKLEIANLVSKNTLLTQQEKQSRILKDEMQKMKFMKEELLVQNNSLLDRLRSSKYNLPTNTEINPDHINSALEIENKHLKEQLESIYDELNATWKREKAVTLELEEFKEKQQCLNNEIDSMKKIKIFAETKCSLLGEHNDMLLQKLIRFDSKAQDHKSRYDYSSNPELKQISQNVQNVLLAVEKLASCSNAEKSQRSMLEVDDLRHRLILAKEEYERLHRIMMSYRTKYYDLKAKCKPKKAPAKTNDSTLSTI
ncbi:tax1-binding protein 1 homolog B-like [Neodiprion virginianus]|uniref:tax1-binding protein 1 homolog B-like n=1 Tax=Neodiprion virginianus TaxID=2961670 RepID=UPI001EE6C38A|nr:tax1-binding protein 1 homolog B-like [Neodiprion virginianus]XP_046603307.1 tax1-binding protein 1 homolog B-like [Neodiprion virginianus]XP_046603308.1 tax1-binding protein 1 homolog B-like [Neodiprion virginianus]XP_046603309.1 tax1-binding protein 1 homolog B-like [Neodiprion virginianus]